MSGAEERRTARAADRITTERAEAALMEQYTRLVRLAFLVLPPELGRHRRVLTAHAHVQRALPGPRPGPLAPRVPAPAAGAADPGYAWVRDHVLRTALAFGRRPRGWPRRLPPPRALRPALPAVWGLRLFPRAGGVDEASLEQALSDAPAAARAVFALRCLEGLTETEAARLLDRAAGPPPDADLRTADRLVRDGGELVASLDEAREFDPCAVQTRPTDLLRRRQRVRLAAATAAALALGAALLLPVASDPAGRTAVSALTDDGAQPAASAMGAARLLRAPSDGWADTSRVDFTAWPARGGRIHDTALLDRALDAWARPAAARAEVTTAASTPTGPPAEPAHLLYAGDVDGHATVLLYDGRRVVRYTEPVAGDAAPTLAFARADDADVTTAAAVVVSRTEDRVRFLLAPWIDRTETRDMLRPDTPAKSAGVGPDGVTRPVPRPRYGGGCDARPALQLRSSSRIVEHHTFVVADLGGLLPVHLTYTPLPGHGAPARQPREATARAALESWSGTACRLAELRGGGVRAVNVWEFAEQRLPEEDGRAVWSCARADTWRGPGDVFVQFRRADAPAATPASVVARARDTAACSRFGQHIVASTRWQAPDSGHHYVLAAGSRAVTAIEATGDVRTTSDGTTLAERAPKDAEVTVRARLKDGGELAPVADGK